MPFVLDSSVALSWILPDERHEAAEALKYRLQEDHGIVPPIWALEIVNILAVSVRTGRLPRKAIERSLAHAHSLSIVVDAQPVDVSMDAILHLAEELHLSGYDASYIECAERNGLAFATLDKRLRAAAIKRGIDVLL